VRRSAADQCLDKDQTVTSGTEGGRKDCAAACIIPNDAKAAEIINRVFIDRRLAVLSPQVMWHKMATILAGNPRVLIRWALGWGEYFRTVCHYWLINLKKPAAPMAPTVSVFVPFAETGGLVTSDQTTDAVRLGAL